jgi:hypothetical protein
MKEKIITLKVNGALQGQWSHLLLELNLITKQMMDGIVLTSDVDCFELCDILRLKLTGYVDKLNLHIMNDSSGNFIGCMCR